MKLNLEHEAEIFDFYLDPIKHPIAFKNRVLSLINSGLTKNKAERIAQTQPIELELYYDSENGLFAFESEAADSITLYNPYTGDELETCE